MKHRLCSGNFYGGFTKLEMGSRLANALVVSLLTVNNQCRAATGCVMIICVIIFVCCTSF